MSVDGEALARALRPVLDLVNGSLTAGQPQLLARLEEVVASAVDVLQVDAVGLVLLDEQDRPRFAAATDDSAVAVERAQLTCDQGPSIDSLRTGIAVAVHDLRTQGAYSELRRLLADTPAGALLSSPVVVDGRAVGTIDVLTHHPHAWSQAQQRSVAAYADVVALALRVNARAGDVDAERRMLQAQVDVGAGAGAAEDGVA